MSGAPRSVGINALYLDPGRSAGTETYLRGLVPALAREFPATRFDVATTRRGAAALRAEGWTSFCTLLQFPHDEGQRLRRLMSEQVRFAAVAAARRWDVAHSLANVAPIWTPCAAVITVHDVSFFHHRTFGLLTTLGMRAIVGAAARRADVLVTAAESARDDISATLGIPADRFVVAPHGAGRPIRPQPILPEELRARMGLPEPARVLLCVAALRPHKNQALLLRALPALPPDVVLVLVGHPEPYADELPSLAASLGVGDRLRVRGYVDDAELEALWSVAAAAALPTRGEGFGLPVIEALAHGVPVACSDLPVLHEVGGELVHRFDPDDAASAAAAISAALDDRDAARLGPARAARFTWEAAARRTFEAYERAHACTSA